MTKKASRVTTATGSACTRRWGLGLRVFRAEGLLHGAQQPGATSVYPVLYYIRSTMAFRVAESTVRSNGLMMHL